MGVEEGMRVAEEVEVTGAAKDAGGSVSEGVEVVLFK